MHNCGWRWTHSPLLSLKCLTKFYLLSHYLPTPCAPVIQKTNFIFYSVSRTYRSVWNWGNKKLLLKKAPVISSIKPGSNLLLWENMELLFMLYPAKNLWRKRNLNLICSSKGRMDLNQLKCVFYMVSECCDSIANTSRQWPIWDVTDWLRRVNQVNPAKHLRGMRRKSLPLLNKGASTLKKKYCWQRSSGLGIVV